MNLRYPKLFDPCLLCKKTLFLSKKTPSFHLSQDSQPREMCKCQIQLLAESSHLWHTIIGSTSILTCSERGMRENIACLLSANSHVCFHLFLFHLLVTQKSKIQDIHHLRRGTETYHLIPATCISYACLSICSNNSSV